MPGLINWTTSTILPLATSEVTSCVSGYAFGMTACLSYRNSENHPFEGFFVYPLDEYTTVVGFEAVISERVVTVQIKDKARIEESCFSDGRAPDEAGHVVLDEDLERIVFVASVGIVPPQVDVSICISTSSELQTLPTGAVRVLLPAVCAPRVAPRTPQFSSSSPHPPMKDGHCSGVLPPEQAGKFCLAYLLEAETTNPAEYEFSFSLEIRGPCLLAGVESPTHEIRADADPLARSARSITIRLAHRHTFDRPVEILIHPSEPHMPHVLMEEGDMAPAQYEQHLRGRSDFIKGTKKDPSPEKKVEIIRKRLHKDIPHHPVIMLNFCPDLKTVQPNLRKTHGEFIFLVDRSRSMAGTNIARVKDALVVILKSLMPGCLFNLIGFGSTFKAAFPASQAYSEENLAGACESIKKIRADMGSTNLLSPLKWVIRQPIHRGHPRLLFLLTDGAVGNTGKVLGLLRSHASSTRCYTFGIGKNACRRLLKGLAAVTKGSAEFLAEGERVQPKMIKSLKKAMAPVVSDVSVDWVFPETTEVLISPVNTSCLFPGDRLVAYSVVCDTSLYVSHPRLVSGCHRLAPAGLDAHAWSSGLDGPSGPGFWMLVVQLRPRRPCVFSDPITTSQRRAYSTTQAADREPPQKLPTASDSSSIPVPNPLRKVHLQDLSRITLDAQPWQVELQVRVPDASISRVAITPRGLWIPTMGDHLTFLAESAQHPSFNFETESTSDWDLLDLEPSSSAGGDWRGSRRSLCKALVKGLQSGEPVKWEITFDLGPLFQSREDKGQEEEEDIWNETFHHLAAKSIVQDFEQLAEREFEIEHGSGRRYQANAVHTSKSCNVISKFTAFVPVDLSSNDYLPSIVKYPNTGEAQSACEDTVPSVSSQKSIENFFGARLTFNKTRLLTKAARGFMGKFPAKSNELSSENGNENVDYLPLVSLQLACGSFLLNKAFSEAINIPLEKLRWTSPFACHRMDLSPSTSSRKAEAPGEAKSARAADVPGSHLHKEAEEEEEARTEPEGMLWATAVALAWLEHSSASYFIEWELVAAKASRWLGEQDIPEGRTLPALKTAAQQLFVLLRHWNENLQFNLLCYNPKDV
uniref:von Willebrand factor A domain containing 5B1 n=1 Tax=Naja naja TaxID=35670 RepID=A0A8C6XY28_NAJNA